MMALMQRLTMGSLEQTSRRIELNQERLDEALNKLIDKLTAAAKKAAENKDSGGGLFGWVSDTVDAVVDFAVDIGGDLLGKSADFIADLATAPFDIIAGLLQGNSLSQLLQAELEQLGSDGDMANKVKQFTEGVGKFAADLFVFMHAHWGVIEAALRGENVWDAIQLHAGNLYDSFVENCIDNEAVWQVTSFAMKVLGVAAAVVSGGALSFVAVGLVVLSELDKRYHVAEQLLPEDVAPYVSIGIEVAGSILLAYAAGDFESLGDVFSNTKNTTAVITGTFAIAKGLHDCQIALEQARELERQADIVEIMNRMGMLQRLLEALLDEFEDKSDDEPRFVEGANRVYQTVGASYQAAVMSS
jgi:hypothetical protein